jgi:hypothetical protein
MTVSRMLSIGSLSAVADKDAVRFAAKVNNDWKCCARIPLRDYSGVRSKETCRTLAQWEALGSMIQMQAVQSELDHAIGSGGGK